jgi:hypothetical protein
MLGYEDKISKQNCIYLYTSINYNANTMRAWGKKKKYENMEEINKSHGKQRTPFVLLKQNKSAVTYEFSEP